MRTFTLITGAALLSLTSAMAQAIPFMSGLDDTCVNCTLSNPSQTAPVYLDPNTTPELNGAIWIQDSSAWNVDDVTYRIYEEDLDETGHDRLITSLFVSYDNALQIKSNGNVLFDSNDYNVAQPWTAPIDVIALLGGPLALEGDGRLNFYVYNSPNVFQSNQTGVIWKGTSVPEPGTLALFGLGLAGVGISRRRKQA